MMNRNRAQSAGTRLVGLRVRIPPTVWVSVCCGCCDLSSRGLYDGPITRPEKSCRVCVCVCVSLSVIRCCNNNIMRLHGGSGKCRTKYKVLEQFWRETVIELKAKAGRYISDRNIFTHISITFGTTYIAVILGLLPTFQDPVLRLW
jgi:hypothetical protein